MTKLVLHPVGRRKLAEEIVHLHLKAPAAMAQEWRSRAKAQKISLSELIRRAMEGK